jgi:hypothetical protein
MKKVKELARAAASSAKSQNQNEEDLGIIEEDESGQEVKPIVLDDAFGDFFARKQDNKSNAKQQLRDAIRSGDVSALEKLLPTFGEGTLKASKTMKLGRAMVDKIKNGKVILMNLRKAITDLDRPRMKELLEQARDLELDVDDTILEARKLCFGILDSDFRSLQFKKAIEQKDIEQLKNLISVSLEQRTSKPFIITFCFTNISLQTMMMLLKQKSF